MYRTIILILLGLFTVVRFIPTIYKHFYQPSKEGQTEKKQKTSNQDKVKSSIHIIIYISVLFFLVWSVEKRDNIFFYIYLLLAFNFNLITFGFSSFILTKGLLKRKVTLEPLDIQNGLYALTIIIYLISGFSDHSAFTSSIHRIENVILQDFVISILYLVLHAINSFVIVANITNILYSSSIYFNYKMQSWNIKPKIFNRSIYDCIKWYLNKKTDDTYGLFNSVNVFLKPFIFSVYILFVAVEMVITYFLPILLVPIKIIINSCKWLFRKFKNLHLMNFDKIVYLVARISFIYSIALTYIIFNYFSVISDSGFIFFEFMATIFLLPIIFNEITKFKESNSKRET